VIRVVIVDDHAVVRSGLRLLLDAEDDIEVVAEAGDVRNAVFAVRAQKPDVVLLDLVLPGESGIDAVAKLLREAPQMKALVLSM
jgi:two-component system, NarL family, response regulator NreC